MEQLINISLSPANIVITLLMLLMIVYWLLTMISGIDFDLDVDVDIDVDTDIDVDSKVHLDGHSLEIEDVSSIKLEKEHVVSNRRKQLKWWQILLVYFNFVGLPFMFTLTCWIFIWWFITVLSTTLTLTYNNIIGQFIFLGSMIPALILNKIFTTPFKIFFKNFNQDGDKPIDLIGRTGTILSTISGDKMGSAEVVANENPMSIYVKSLGGTEIKYKEKILIIKKSKDNNYYWAQIYQE